jgi:hypothetical protein
MALRLQPSAGYVELKGVVLEEEDAHLFGGNAR